MLAGRRPDLNSFDVIRRRAEELGEGDRGWVLNGLRGVGKTALLNQLHAQVSESKWIAAKVEVTSSVSLPVALAAELVRAMRTATGRHPVGRLRRLLGVFQAFSLSVNPAGVVTVGAEVAPIKGVADSGRFADDLAALFEVLGETSRDLGIGTLILVDELQEGSADELTAINTAVHLLGQAAVPLPLIFIGAGLPSLPAQLADATSYAERLYDYKSIGLLTRGDAKEALQGPTSELGVDWQDEAIDAALNLAAGYPYFLQSVGKHVWDNAIRSPITVDDVAVGGRAAKREVDEGLYRSRWERATPAQQKVMQTMARIGGDKPCPIADVAAAMGKKRVSDLGVARNELIKKGLVYAPERGQLAFTVPGMHVFINEQD